MTKQEQDTLTKVYLLSLLSIVDNHFLNLVNGFSKHVGEINRGQIKKDTLANMRQNMEHMLLALQEVQETIKKEG